MRFDTQKLLLPKVFQVSGHCGDPSSLSWVSSSLKVGKPCSGLFFKTAKGRRGDVTERRRDKNVTAVDGGEGAPGEPEVAAELACHTHDYPGERRARPLSRQTSPLQSR